MNKIKVVVMILLLTTLFLNFTPNHVDYSSWFVEPITSINLCFVNYSDLIDASEKDVDDKFLYLVNVLSSSLFVNIVLSFSTLGLIFLWLFFSEKIQRRISNIASYVFRIMFLIWSVSIVRMMFFEWKTFSFALVVYLGCMAVVFCAMFVRRANLRSNS